MARPPYNPERHGLASINSVSVTPESCNVEFGIAINECLAEVYRYGAKEADRTDGTLGLPLKCRNDVLPRSPQRGPT